MSSSDGGVLDRTKTSGKKGLDRVWDLVDHLGVPANRLSNRLGAEAFWPSTLDKESDKAARILRSFCRDGFFEDEPQRAQRKRVQTIPREVTAAPSPPLGVRLGVIANARGLAIFTTMRTGLWVSGSGGSGVLLARRPDGAWSPPSGIMLHTIGLGFLAGVDIYDCVLVINTQAALDALAKARCAVAGELGATAGPLGVGGLVEPELRRTPPPVYSYLKSRGLYAGVQIDGTVVVERTDENERFYRERRIRAADIFSGRSARLAPPEVRPLLQTIKAAQGDADALHGELPTEPAPGDFELERAEQPVFGIPDIEDPDPFGVRALEKQGLAIREAGSGSRPPSEQFEYRPSPTSPIFGAFNRGSVLGGRRSIDTFSGRSIDTVSGRSRESYQRKSVDRGVQTEDRSTQTPPQTPTPSDTRRASEPWRIEELPMVQETETTEEGRPPAPSVLELSRRLYSDEKESDAALPTVREPATDATSSVYGDEPPSVRGSWQGRLSWGSEKRRSLREIDTAGLSTDARPASSPRTRPADAPAEPSAANSAGRLPDHPRSPPHSPPLVPGPLPDPSTPPPVGLLDDDDEGDLLSLPGSPSSIEIHDASATEPAPAAQVVFHAAAPQLISKARLVTIPKRLPPALPPRSPARPRIVTRASNDVVPAETASADVSPTHQHVEARPYADGRKGEVLPESPVSPVSPPDTPGMFVGNGSANARVRGGSSMGGDEETFHSLPSTP
ncbi:MAG: hypothetical protein M1832_001411 [Thelocarpon impressellum]|nr:MAG: hypothetical protein M1832_001411 [Thelocarpon impressellum]